MKIRIKKAKNGLNIICAETPYLNKASLVVLVRGGSVYENKNNNGVFHLIEHSIFNGSKKYKNSEEIENKISELGLIEDVQTNKEFTKYSFGFHSKNSCEALEFISEILLNPIFNEKQINKEKKIIAEELSLDANDNYRKFYIKSNKLLFKKNPLNLDPAGTKKSLSNLSASSLKQIYQRYYVANNMVMVYAGNLPSEKILSAIKENFAFLKKGEGAIYPKFKFERNKKFAENSIKIGTDFNFISFAFLVSFSKQKDKDLIYLLKDIINKKIQDNLIFKEKMGYDLGVNVTEFEKIGLLDICGGLTKNNKEKILKILKKEIFFLEITEMEFQQAKNKISDNFDLMLDNSFELSEYLAFNLLDENKLITPQQGKALFQKITLADIQNFAKKILTQENSFLFIAS